MTNDELTAHIERLTREMKGWESLGVRIVYQHLDKDGGPTGRTDLHYVETASGLRLLESRFGDSTGQGLNETAYCDGKRCAFITRDEHGAQRSISISKSFHHEARFGATSKPMPFQYQHAGLTPIYQAIRKAEKVGSGAVLGRPCDLYHFPRTLVGSSRVEYLYHLDQATSVPLKVELFSDLEAYRSSLARQVWEAEEIKTIDGHLVPVRSRYLSYRIVPDTGERTVKSSMSIQVESLAYDQAYPRSMFWTEFEPGVQVLDGIKNTAYIVPGKETNLKSQPVASPLEATPPTDWATYGPWIGATLCIALLGSGAVLWWRRR